MSHVIKQTHSNGVPLAYPVYYCGRIKHPFDWAFLDADHAAKTPPGDMGGVCKQCVRKIIKELERHLE